MSGRTGIISLRGRLGAVNNQLTNTFVVTSYVMNTALFTTFTNIAISYQRYRPRYIKLHAVPLDKFQAGWSCLCFSPNPKATVPGTMSDMLNTTHRHFGNSGDHLTLEFHVDLNVEWLNCRVSGSIDDLLESFGITWISTDGTKSAYNATTPYVIDVEEFHVEFEEVTNSSISPEFLSLLQLGDNKLAAQYLLQKDKPVIIGEVSEDETEQLVCKVSSKPFAVKKKAKVAKKPLFPSEKKEAAKKKLGHK